VKPFLLLATRAEDAAADNEYESFLHITGLAERDLHRARLEARPLGDVDLGEWSGIFLGGGPFNSSDPKEKKSPVQVRVESDLRGVLDRLIAEDFPFLGACYGIGTLGSHQGAVIDRQYAEPVGAIPITLTEQGRQDPVFGGLPDVFEAFVGHKEAISRLPRHAVLLAGSATCPVQAFRIGSHVYATQFHPELDVAGLCTRVDVYKYAGYFAPEEAEGIKALARASSVVHPPTILRRFVARYAHSGSIRVGARTRRPNAASSALPRR
jgi:GMP synthase (glutamine-hydrolysing)